MQSCESKKSYKSKFDEIISEISNNFKNYFDKDWAKADTTFADFVKEDLNKWNKESKYDLTLNK